MLELKQYQENAINALEDFCKALRVEGSSSESCMQIWEEIGGLHDYKPRISKSHKNIPSVCLKIPTGGGKTLLGIKGIHAINREFLQKNTGLVVWIVPTTAIYEQTLKNLKNYDHPYRQALDRIAPNRRVKIKEKKDKIEAFEVQNDLVVLLLMLQSISREDVEGLKMYQNSSKYQNFFPGADDIQRTKEITDKVKNLDTETQNFKTSIKSSLSNVVRICNPIIILDEAHRASAKTRIGLNAVNDMNPSFLLELTATPVKENSNIIVDISGLELKKESMIKMPIGLGTQDNAEWKDIVHRTVDKLKYLDKLARKNQNETGLYIRPIALIRVERTGEEQRGKGWIHADDVREYLINKMKYDEKEVRIKTSQKDEIGNEDLLSDECQVKFIITKDALKEGWDCPFAYILTILDNAKSTTGLTQMLGRVLRQPYIRNFDSEELNMAHVFCLNPDVRNMVKAIQNALKNEGLEDAKHLINRIADDNPIVQRSVLRRPEYRGISYVVPEVLIMEDGKPRRLEYERDILANLHWKEITAPTPSLPLNDKAEETFTKINLGGESKTERNYIFSKGKITAEEIALQINDIVPNTWQAARIGREYIEQLSKHTEEQQYNNKQHYLSKIREHVLLHVDERAERYFKAGVEAGQIYLNFNAEHCNWKIPDKIGKIILQNDVELKNEDGNKVQNSLFEMEIERHYNNYEEGVAVYLEKQGDKNTIKWWHRVAKGQQFGIQGWRKHLVYPDFIMLANGAKSRYIYLETKGDHLKEMKDTKAKKELFRVLSNSGPSMGTGTISCNGQPKSVDLKMIYESEWKKGVLRDFISEAA